MLARSLAVLLGALVPVAADVVCGGHTAPTCSECPQNNGAAWCNGECIWKNGECTKGCFGLSESQCTVGCTWHQSTGLCRDELSDNIRTASVHLNYDPPSGVSKPSWWWQRIVPVAAADATYFSSSGHAYGYGGIQRVSEGSGRAIFSIWDSCDSEHNDCSPEDLASTVACGTGVRCEGFGGEGTGRKSQLDSVSLAESLVGSEHFFVASALPVGGDDGTRVRFSGFVFAEALGGWRFLSTIESKRSAQGWWLQGLSSFVEQWVAGDTLSPRAAAYGPSFMSDASDPTNFKPVPSATFSHGTLENHYHVNAWRNAAENSVGIATGGAVTQTVPRGHIFSYDSEPAAVQPEALLDFKARVLPCLLAAESTTVAIESCLAAAPPTAPPSERAPPIAPPLRPCCLAMTAECLSCAAGISEEEFCAKPENSNVAGCEPKPQPRPCCLAMTAQCLSCAEGISEEAFCAKPENSNVVGCEPKPQPCCRALTAQCLSCTQGISEEEFCAKPENSNVVGCEAPPKVCCRALTAQCLSCTQGISEEEFCAKPENSNVAGCEPRGCCKAETPECKACQAGMSVEDWCKENKKNRKFCRKYNRKNGFRLSRAPSRDEAEESAATKAWSPDDMQVFNLQQLLDRAVNAPLAPGLTMAQALVFADHTGVVTVSCLANILGNGLDVTSTSLAAALAAILRLDVTAIHGLEAGSTRTGKVGIYFYVGQDRHSETEEHPETDDCTLVRPLVLAVVALTVLLVLSAVWVIYSRRPARTEAPEQKDIELKNPSTQSVEPAEIQSPKEV